MGKIDELIRELCPNGVEIMKLKEVSEMKRGTSLTKAKAVEGDIPPSRAIRSLSTPVRHCLPF